MDLNTRIQKIIEYSMLTASEFAEEIGVQRSNISHIISGRNKPSLDFIIKIKDRFPEIQWEWIINGKGDMLSPTTPPEPERISSKINSEEQTTNSIPDLFSIINEPIKSKEEIKNTNTQKIQANLRELNITESYKVKDQINDSQQLEKKESYKYINNTDNQVNNIKKIIFFYENGKFEIFEP